MSLGVHFPSDVIAGAIIGTGCALGCSWIIKRDRAKTN
jgi:membrane-associated phospholipid phosphatase